jgi:hypothetical protein
LVLALLLFVAWLLLVPAGSAVAGQPECAVLDIHQIGHTRLGALIATPGIDSWLELDDELFVCGPADTLAALEQRAPVRRSLGALASDRLRLAYKRSHVELEERGLRILAAGGLFTVVETPESFEEREEQRQELLPFRSQLVLARQIANQPARTQPAAGDGTVADLVTGIRPDRWFADVNSLSAYNRYTLGSELTPARKWLKRQFRSLPGVKVRDLFFVVNGTRVANVVATLPGRTRPRDQFIVGGHYDSTSDDPLVAAPGAEDNASGCAGVLEMARIFAASPPEATILFICYAGEEQGLIGAAAHLEELLANGEVGRVGAMLNLDMIGFTADADLDCLLQSDPDGQALIDLLVDSAARHTGLRVVTSTVIGGSDHVPYAMFGIPAVLSIEGDSGVYPHYHRTTDTPDHLTPEMAAEILRMNVGALARFTGNSDVSGCLKLEGEPLENIRVSAKQGGSPRQAASSDRLGCFAVDPVERGKTVQVRIKGLVAEGDEAAISGCVRLLGDPATKRRVIFRQPGEPRKKVRSDDDGCFVFEPVAEERFTLVFKGPEVPVE